MGRASRRDKSRVVIGIGILILLMGSPYSKDSLVGTLHIPASSSHIQALSSLRFVGAIPDGDSFSALVEHSQTGSQELFLVGDQVFHTGRLVQVTKQSIALQVGDKVGVVHKSGGVSEASSQPIVTNNKVAPLNVSLEEVLKASPGKNFFVKDFSKPVTKGPNGEPIYAPHRTPLTEPISIVRGNDGQVGLAFSEETRSNLGSTFGISKNQMIIGMDGVPIDQLVSPDASAQPSKGKNVSLGEFLVGLDSSAPKSQEKNETGWYDFQVLDTQTKSVETLRLRVKNGLTQYTWEKPN